MNNNIVTAVQDRGRLYIAYGNEEEVGKQVGTSIRVYEQGTWKTFFANLFGFAVSIEVAGKMRGVNYNSLHRHVWSLNEHRVGHRLRTSEAIDAFIEARIRDIQVMGYDYVLNGMAQFDYNFQTTEEKVGKVFFRKKLSHSISREKQDRLFDKMIWALERNDTERVMKLIHKGAPVDKVFFEINEIAPIPYAKRSELIQAMNERQEHQLKEIRRFTPLAKAVSNENQTLCRFIANAKKGDCSADKGEKWYPVYSNEIRVGFKDYEFYRVVVEEGEYWLIRG